MSTSNEITGFKYNVITPTDKEFIELIARWYFEEWKIPSKTTMMKLANLLIVNNEFQILMTLDNEPVASGGLYNHVSLIDKEPRFKIYRNWLALVYTKPDMRGKGLGMLICKHIELCSRDLGLKKINLFTHTAESLYKRLGWQELERLALVGKDVVVMKKEL